MTPRALPPGKARALWGRPETGGTAAALDVAADRVFGPPNDPFSRNAAGRTDALPLIRAPEYWNNDRGGRVSCDRRKALNPGSYFGGHLVVET
ncbi:hypothetical protein SAMN05444166_2543 [Singulisphaera sp. GP187]|nr:hypothetical protein SAMN05444166_2543 [Singulisphaera sp. GP187]